MKKDKSPLQQLLILPTEAQNRLERDSSTNQNLSYQYEGQSTIIQDISSSIPDSETIAKKISDIDSQIVEVDQSLNEALSILNNLLQQPKSDSNAAGTILSTILLNTIKSINEIVNNSIQKKRPFVSIFDVMNIEQQIFSIIGDLSERGLLLESEEELQNRTSSVTLHTNKLLQFLKDLNLTSNEQ